VKTGRLPDSFSHMLRSLGNWLEENGSAEAMQVSAEKFL
jgi:hypothetical protein